MVNQYGVEANTKIEHFKLTFDIVINSNVLDYHLESLVDKCEVDFEIQ